VTNLAGDGSPGRVLPYIWSVVAVGLAVGIRGLLQPALGYALPFATLAPTVFFIAYLWGFGPTALGTIVGGLAALYLFIGRGYSFDLTDPVAHIGLGLFALTGMVAGWFGEARLRAVRRAERAAGSARAQADFFENASTPMHWVGEHGAILRANQAELDMLGYQREEYVGHHIAEFHADGVVVAELLERLRAGEAVHRYPARLRCKGGRIKEVLIDSSPYRVDGQFIHTHCLTRDVTLEKQANEAVARLAAIVSSSSDAIIGKTLEGIVTSWNVAAERIFGYPASEMVGQAVFKLIPEEMHDAERSLLERVRRGEVVELAEVERIRRDGRRIWISLSVSPIRDSSGVITGAASIKRDITERKAADLELRQNQEQLQLAHRAARLGAWRWEVVNDELRWDDELRRLYGLAPGDRIRAYHDFIEWVHPEDRDRVVRAVQEALTAGGALDYEFRIVQPDGSIRWLADLGRVTSDSDGRPVYLTGICMDVTERKAVEEHLR
jgi:PAS domain S-box-containing protein